ncbi:MAG: hypothetical protein ABSB78_03520 [Bacteroidota bacterium]
MEKHITLVGVLNIVYRGLAIIVAMVLIVIALGFGGLFDFLIRSGSIKPHEIPIEVLNIIPLILLIIAIIIISFSTLGIIGAIGVLKRKEWARILLLVISFFNLVRVPLGTILGVYSIWVLLNNETIKLFNPVSGSQGVGTSI